MSPIPVDRIEKKRQIARSAIRVFARNGYGGTKVVDIAAEAGIGKGTVYEYFRGKDAVFSFAVQQFFLDMGAHLWEKIGAHDDPMDRLKVLIEGSIDLLNKSGPEAKFLFQVWAEGIQTGNAHIDLKEIYSSYRESISAILRDGIRRKTFRTHDPDLVASILIGALDGLALQSISDPDAIPLDQTTDELYDLMARSLRL